ncbi:MAG: hypothetical protein PHG81_13705 [Aliarcobacter sp.]|nr:hypothetical protein [Aliarcobacter sp.]
MKKELLIFVSLLVILSFGIHYKEFLTQPFVHILNLSKSGAYGLGFSHPFIFTFIVYLVILLPRFVIKLLKRSFK